MPGNWNILHARSYAGRVSISLLRRLKLPFSLRKVFLGKRSGSSTGGTGSNATAHRPANIVNVSLSCSTTTSHAMFYNTGYRFASSRIGSQTRHCRLTLRLCRETRLGRRRRRLRLFSVLAVDQRPLIEFLPPDGSLGSHIGVGGIQPAPGDPSTRVVDRLAASTYLYYSLSHSAAPILSP
jgi:hypothetical protein